MQKQKKESLPSARQTQVKRGKAVTTLRENTRKESEQSATKEATQRFVKDLLVRGEAATLTKKGKLPLSATHVIIKKNPDGSVEVKRARYKAF